MGTYQGALGRGHDIVVHVTSLPQTGLVSPGRLPEGVISLLKGEESWKDTGDICVVCEASVGCQCSSMERTLGFHCR